MKLSKKTRWWVGSLLGLVLVVGLLYFYRVYDPAATLFAPKCLFKLITGWSCPGCGGQRALHAMLHGDIIGGLAYNPIWVVMIPYAALLSYLRIFGGDARFPRLANALDGNVAIVLFCIVTVVYTVLRNVYGF